MIKLYKYKFKVFKPEEFDERIALPVLKKYFKLTFSSPELLEKSLFEETGLNCFWHFEKNIYLFRVCEFTITSTNIFEELTN